MFDAWLLYFFFSIAQPSDIAADPGEIGGSWFVAVRPAAPKLRATK